MSVAHGICNYMVQGFRQNVGHLRCGLRVFVLVWDSVFIAGPYRQRVTSSPQLDTVFLSEQHIILLSTSRCLKTPFTLRCPENTFVCISVLPISLRNFAFSSSLSAFLFCGEGPRSRSYGCTAAISVFFFIFPCNGAPMEWNWQGKNEVLGEKPVPLLLCSPQIPHGLTQDRTRACAMRGRRLTAWTMGRPSLSVVSWNILLSTLWAQSQLPENVLVYLPYFREFLLSVSRLHSLFLSQLLQIPFRTICVNLRSNKFTTYFNVDFTDRLPDFWISLYLIFKCRQSVFCTNT
jgi:hypothetical protein